jgi:hypothetical protein
VRHVHSLGHRAEMLVQTFLGRLVVIGHHRQAVVRACLLGIASQFDRLSRGVGSGTGKNWNAAGCVLDRCGDQFAMFGEINRRRFTGGADDANRVGSFANMKSIETATGKSSHRRRHGRDSATRLPLSIRNPKTVSKLSKRKFGR